MESDRTPADDQGPGASRSPPCGPSDLRASFRSTDRWSPGNRGTLTIHVASGFHIHRAHGIPASDTRGSASVDSTARSRDHNLGTCARLHHIERMYGMTIQKLVGTPRRAVDRP